MKIHPNVIDELIAQAQKDTSQEGQKERPFIEDLRPGHIRKQDLDADPDHCQQKQDVEDEIQDDVADRSQKGIDQKIGQRDQKGPQEP